MVTALARPKHCERRRSCRASACIDLLVRGDKGLWEERTCALSWNAHGVLVALGTRVALGERIIVRNLGNLKEGQARVVTLGRAFGRRQEVGIEFAEPSATFWMDFANRERARIA